MTSETHEWPSQEGKENRLADEMFLESVLRCNCLRDEHLRILSTLADKFLAQVNAAQDWKTRTQDG